MIKTRVFLLAAWFAIAATATVAQPGTPGDLVFYADIMVHAARPEHRMRAADSFHHYFKDRLHEATALTRLFSEMPWIVVVAPDDSSFQIVTWQVQERESARYYGYILFRDERAPVALRHTRTLRSELAPYDQDTWYGALYYGIQSFRTSGGSSAWVLLGFNAADGTKNQRVADILTMDNGSIRFGMPLFESPHKGEEPRSRILLEYAEAASATMRFDRDRSMLIYDHVIAIQTPQGPALVPDGSYHGYVLKKGSWQFVDDVFENAPNTPPPGTGKERQNRDLFGRDIGKRD